MFAGHLPELMIVVVLALLVFGPKRLPEMGNAVGKTIKEFRKSMSEITSGEDKNSADRQIASAPSTKVAIESSDTEAAK